MVNTCPDIAYAVGVVSRYIESPTTRHLAAVKQILRYVKGTINYCCNYIRAEKELELVGYNDSDLAGDINDRKSTTGVFYFLCKSHVTWLSQKQNIVTIIV